MKLRPHHLLDIVTTYGWGGDFKPHPYGHAVHTVAEKVLADPDLEVEFIIGSDEICVPCRHLREDGRCGDVLDQCDPPVSKQDYNDDLDRRLCAHLGFPPHTVMTVREFLKLVNGHVPGIEAICTHPGQNKKKRRESLIGGLTKLGIRTS